MQRKNNVNAEEGQLYNYQRPIAQQLSKILTENGTALDASDPGIGKTYVASYICKTLNLVPIVICPKSVICSWKKVLSSFNVEPLLIVNYELIGRGKYIYNNTKLLSPLIKVNGETKSLFTWTVPNNAIFIFDEVHRCKNINTVNAQLLLSAHQTHQKILMLSATIVEKPIEFAIFAYILNFSKSLKLIKDWIKKLYVPAQTIHKLLYNKKDTKAVRLSIATLGDAFPDTQISADTYTMTDSAKIKNQYSVIQKKVKKGFSLIKLQTEFRNIELLKVPTFVELTNDYIANGLSVVIFVNYVDTLNALSKILKTNTLIYGNQHAIDRDKCIDDFQSNKSRIMIANIKAGNAGISLHDLHGNHPRVSLISPTFSATNLVQVLGRIHRANGKSKSLQRIIFASNTPEDRISKLLSKKLNNLSLLNDGDMETYYIDGLTTIVTNNSNNDSNNNDIVLDEQLKKIKSKNFKKVKNMSNLFPELIDKVSGARSFYLFRGKNEYKNKQILLLGEYHNVNNSCKTCDKNCLEIIDLITYVMYSVSPMKVDFYNETKYHGYQKDKFEGVDNEKTMSRIDDLHKLYYHLLNSKHINTENLRMHSGDVRGNSNNLRNNYDSAYIFNVLNHIFFQILSYDFYYIFDKFYYENTRKFRIDVNDIFINCDLIYNILKELLVVFNSNSEEVKDIINGDSEKLLKLLKITKQSNSTIVDFEQSINNVYHKSSSKAYDNIIEPLINILSDIDYINDKQKYLDTFFTNLVKTRFLDNKYYKNVLDILASYMDKYILYRMMRKFDGIDQDCVIVYAGDLHIQNIYKVLKQSSMFSNTVKNVYNSKGTECLNLIKAL